MNGLNRLRDPRRGPDVGQAFGRADGCPGQSRRWTFPLRRFTKPLDECRAALITTGGIHLPEQKPFDMTNPDGDPSYREIPGDVVTGDIVITHKYYDHVTPMRIST